MLEPSYSIREAAFIRSNPGGETQESHRDIGWVGLQQNYTYLLSSSCSVRPESECEKYTRRRSASRSAAG